MRLDGWSFFARSTGKLLISPPSIRVCHWNEIGGKMPGIAILPKRGEIRFPFL